MIFSTPAFPDNIGRAGSDGNGSKRPILGAGTWDAASGFFRTDCAEVRAFLASSKPHDAAIRRVDEIPASSICGITAPQASKPVVASGVPWPILEMR